MNARFAWKYVLIMLLVILPGSAFVGVIFYPITWGFSIPTALFIFPLLFIIGWLFNLAFINDLDKQKSRIAGLLAAALLWITVWLGFLLIPSPFQFLFHHTVPGLARSSLEKEGKQIAAAVSGTFIQSFVSEGHSRVAVKGWAGFVTASVLNGSLSIQGGTADSLPSKDSITVIRRFSNMSCPFLNARGRQLMQAGHITVRSRRNPTRAEFDLFVMDRGNIAIRSFATVHGLSFTISKGYSMLDE